MTYTDVITAAPLWTAEELEALLLLAVALGLLVCAWAWMDGRRR